MSLEAVRNIDPSYQMAIQGMHASYLAPPLPSVDDIHKAIALLRGGLLVSDQRGKLSLECETQLTFAIALQHLELAVDYLLSYNADVQSALNEMHLYVEGLYKEPDVVQTILSGINKQLFQSLATLFCNKFYPQYMQIQQRAQRLKEEKATIEEEFHTISFDSSTHSEPVKSSGYGWPTLSYFTFWR